MNRELQDQLAVAALIGRYSATHQFDIARDVAALNSAAKSLRKRYANSCNYEWAMTRSYVKRTETLERRIGELGKELGGVVELQGDPRGSPVIFKFAEWTYRFG
jgi:hypothetical protein